MPFTPFHFGPSATIAIPLYTKIDVFVFLLANVVIDLESLLVMTNKLHYPLHGYAHTFIGAIVLVSVWGIMAWVFRYKIKMIVQDVFRFPFEPSRGKMVLSGILGACFHVVLDSPLYSDIKPFYPLTTDPIFGIIDNKSMYNLCTIFIVPAIGLYVYRLKRNKSL
ncbi:MAG: hypothetical protein HY753_07295 [Nitrospirae bacterium]|nr:hypothetical protein [Nitrospirota bacterium]